MNEIYYCRKLWKDRDQNIEKGDIGWILDKDLPDIISRCRLLLHTVKNWEEYDEHPEIPFFKNKEPKTRVYFKGGGFVTLLLKIEQFDKDMELYYSSVVQFKQN